MNDTPELKSLFRLLSQRPRLAIVDAISRTPGLDGHSIAFAVSRSDEEIEGHLRALHEGGVLALEDDGWHISPKVSTETDGDCMHFKAHTRDGSMLRLRFDPANSL